MLNFIQDTLSNIGAEMIIGFVSWIYFTIKKNPFCEKVSNNV